MDFPVNRNFIGTEHVSLTLTEPASAGTKGNWEEVISSLAHDTVGLGLHFYQSTGGIRCLFDIGIGSSGNEVAILNDFSLYQTTYSLAGSDWFYLPIRLPAGTRITCRLQKSSLNGTAYVHMRPLYGHQAGGQGIIPLCTRTLTIGTDAANTRGTLVTSGTSDSFGSYTNFDGGFDLPVWGFYLNALYTAAAWPTEEFGFEIALGEPSSEVTLIPEIRSQLTGGSDFWHPDLMKLFFPVAIPAGVDLNCRWKTDGTSARSIYVQLIGLVK